MESTKFNDVENRYEISLGLLAFIEVSRFDQSDYKIVR